MESNVATEKEMQTPDSDYHSIFGGFWTDRSDAEDILERRLQSGDLSESVAQKIRNWIKNGFVYLEGAIDEALIDAVNEEVDASWKGKYPKIHCTFGKNEIQHKKPIKPYMQDIKAKLLDLYAYSETTRKAFFTQPILEFLNCVFEAPPMVFQSLYFERGSEQAMHQDSAFVRISEPMKFVGVWIALEDIKPGSGELEYYAGSHKQPEFLWNGESKSMPESEWRQPQHTRFLESLHENAEKYGYTKEKHYPKKGDVLIWHADLSHGGSPQTDPSLTRRSFAVHMCPSNCQPTYMLDDRKYIGPRNCNSGGAFSYELHTAVPEALHHRAARKIKKIFGAG